MLGKKHDGQTATPSDRSTFYRLVNATAHPLDSRLLHEVIGSVSVNPDSTAIAWRDGHWTWGELRARASALTERLVRIDEPGTDRVGVPVEPANCFVAGMLGVLSAGRAYIPLETGSPREWKRSILAATACRCLIRGENLEIERSAGPDTAPPSRPITEVAEPLAYIISTSGSSGSPRAVAVSHRAVVNHILGYSRHIALDRPQVFLVATSLAASLTVTSVFLSLCHGHRLVLADASDPEGLTSLARQEAPTVLKIAPSVLRRILPLAQRNPSLFQNLKTLIVSAEPVRAADLRPWHRLYPGLSIVVAYGCSEALSTTTLPVAPWMLREEATLPVGRPTLNNRIYVVDSSGTPVSPLENGEIVVAGAGLFSGYVLDGRLDRTPLEKIRLLGKRETIFRTGDLGYLQSDGSLVVTGRRDFQVKVRGFRTSLQAVETHLMRRPGVRRAVAWIDSSENRELLCRAVEGESHLDTTELRAQLVQQVPSFMIPHHILVCASLPLTPAGKVDRQRAARTVLGAVQMGTNPAQPDDPVAATVAAAWAEIVGAAPADPAMAFACAGGDSLHFVDLLLSLEQRFGIQLWDGKTPRNPTLRTLSAAVKAKLESPERSAANSEEHVLEVTATSQRPLEAGWYEAKIEISSLQVGPTLPLSASQRMRLRNVERAGWDFSYVRLRFPTDFDITLLSGALSRLVARYEALRSRLVEEATAQEILSPRAVATLPVVGDGAAPPGLVDEVVERLGSQPLDPSAWPCFRWVLVRTRDGVELIWQLSHIFVDLFGCDRLTRDLITLCEGAPSDEVLAGVPVTMEQYLTDMTALTWTGEVEAAAISWLKEYADEVRSCERRMRQLGMDRPEVDYTLRLDCHCVTLPVHTQIATYVSAIAEWLQLNRVPLRIGTSGRLYAALDRNYLDLVAQINDHYLTTFDLTQQTQPDVADLVRRRMAAVHDASLNFDMLIQALPSPLRDDMRIGHVFACGPLGELTARMSSDNRIASVPRPEWGIVASRECMSAGLRPTGLAVRLFTYRAKGSLNFHFRFKGIDREAGAELVEIVDSMLSASGTAYG